MNEEQKVEAPVVDIILTNCGQPDMTENCIKSIQDKCTADNYKLYVGSDGAKDHERMVEMSQKYEFTLIESQELLGFAGINDLVLEQTHSPYKLFLNNDTIAETDFISILVNEIHNNPGIGAIGAKLLYPDGTIQFAGHIRNPLAPRWFDHKYRRQERNFLPANRAREVISLTGACLLVSEAALKEVEAKYGHYGLDKNYGMGFEDVDLCFKIREVGLKCWYEPKAVLTHFEGGTRGVGEEAIKDPRQQKSIKYFWSVWTEEQVDRLCSLAYDA